MKYSLLIITFLALFTTIAGCKKTEEEIQAPVITISDEFANVDNFNVGEEVRIDVNVKSAAGVKRLAYYFITRTANGTESGTPVYIDKTDFPQEINEEIVFKVQENMVELVIISFDRMHRNSEIHIAPKNIRAIPVMAFKDDIKYRETVFENKQLKVEGTITSEFDLTAVTYQTIVGGTASEEHTIAITDPKSMPFAASVVVVRNMTAIVIKAKNTYNGTAIDTFKIGSVADDDVAITLEGGNTNIPIAYIGVENTLAGTVSSGSGVSSLSYAVKMNGVYGAETPITIGDPKDEFPFSISFSAAKGIEAVRITGSNEGSKTKVAEYAVAKVYTKLVHFTDIRLTTEIGPGKNNWFAAYQAPHVFDITNAAANQLMVDIALVKYSGTSYRIMPAAVFDAGAAYATAMAPYMVGFTKAPYSLVTANRPSITPEAFESLEWDGQMMEFLDTKVRAPVAAGGENYNFYGTNRRTNSDLKAGQGFIIGWGQWDPIENKAFGIVIVKEYAVTDGVATATLEIKVPEEDNRTKYNPVSIFDYP
ncbi:hypothetical protein [Chitinophaga cymbidii]|uniref:Uncharacterized protein n=1 Tax=Chitinophaga cymbidii TaxID=1096750 RepID=A0A512RLX0_9BACT|nr:hypothetical protein [Chitinophaga cymbidii]GEP96695.1 hypothetical protein CCY01nite_29550 [Chitinophaga cymbidii]